MSTECKWFKVARLPERWGCCLKTVDNLAKRDPSFPKIHRPIDARGHRYVVLDELVRYERSKIKGRAA